jgi:hypothetical protein
MHNRDQRGRFTAGNQVCKLGWAGLVRKQFGGDELIAKAWFAQLGRWYYAKQFVGSQTSMMAMRFSTCFVHPGRPDEFAKRFNFTLSDVPEMRF